MTNQVDFSGVESKLMEILNTPSYEKLIDKVKTASKIFLFGNGGLHFVASHASTDMSRLIPGKAFYSFDSVGFITSNANDHGYENLFVRWLETIITGIENPQNVLLIGLSCSGNSKNVINALQWGEDGGCSTFMISGVRSKILPQQIDELVFSECDTFHMVEVLTLMLFYDVIYKMGNFCPTISGENERKGFGSAYASK